MAIAAAALCLRAAAVCTRPACTWPQGRSHCQGAGARLGRGVRLGAGLQGRGCKGGVAGQVAAQAAVSRCSRSFERLAEVQARADEEELRARREATKASEAAAAAKRLEAELQQLRGIGSQAQPRATRCRLPPCPPPSLTPAPLSPWRPQLSSS